MTADPGASRTPHFVPVDLGRPFVIAHRGASARRPENTLAAFDAAWDASADAVEFDVQRTADAGLVILHDSTLDRTTELRGRVDRTATREVTAARTRFDGVLTDVTVPSLHDVLEPPRAGKRYLIEVKVKGTATAVLDEIRSTSALDRAGVCSFFASELRLLREAEPRLPLILNLPWLRLFRIDGLLDRAAELGAAGVFFFPSRVSQRLVAYAHGLGLEVHAGAVDTVEAALRLVDMGIDAIETNDPAVVVPALVVPA